MRVRTLLMSAVLGAASAVALLPAAPASACITIYIEPIGSPCNPCLHNPVDTVCLRDLRP